MKLTSVAAGLCAVAYATAIPHPNDLDSGDKVGCETPVSLNASTNIFQEYKLHPNIIYRKRAEAAADIIADPELKSRALKIANAGQFVWMQVSYLSAK
jgi:cellulose 1,4-beta-cellobiosidase